MKTTIQISRRTSQDQKCDTGTAVCTPIATGTCVPDPARPAVPGIPASGPIPAVPPIPAYLGSTCRTVTTGPTLVPACTPIAPTLANGYTTTTCPTTTVGPNSVISCTLEDPVAGNAFIRIVCTASRGLAGLQGHVRARRRSLVHRIQRHPVGKFDLATSWRPNTARSSAGHLDHSGPDGDLAFSERSADGLTSVLGRSRPAGAITEYKTTPVTGSIVAMTGGADGHVWFVKDGFGGPPSAASIRRPVLSRLSTAA